MTMKTLKGKKMKKESKREPVLGLVVKEKKNENEYETLILTRKINKGDKPTDKLVDITKKDWLVTISKVKFEPKSFEAIMILESEMRVSLYSHLNMLKEKFKKNEDN